MNGRPSQQPLTKAVSNFLNASAGTSFVPFTQNHPPKRVMLGQVRGSTGTKAAPAGLETPNYIQQLTQKFFARGTDYTAARHTAESKPQT
jgi:hypothetical protein